jgi:predicted acyl esterase
MTAADVRRKKFLPPTALESSVRALGADTVRYRFDYIMLPMRDGVRLATVVIRPRAEGRYLALMVCTPYAVTSIPGQFKPMHTAQFKKNYVLIVQNGRGSEWSEGDFGFLTSTTADAQDTLDWISTQEWSNGKVGLHGCSSTAENQLKLGAIGHPALRACVPMISGAGVGDIPGAEGSNGCFFHGGVPMIKTWALRHAPFGIRLRPKLPLNAEGDELARIFRRYSVSVPDFRDPEYAAALDKATREAPSGEALRRMGSPLTGFEPFMADGPASPAWRDVDLIDASHTGATPSININGWMDVGAYETVNLFEFQQHPPRPVPHHGTDRALQDAGHQPRRGTGPTLGRRRPDAGRGRFCWPGSLGRCARGLHRCPARLVAGVHYGLAGPDGQAGRGARGRLTPCRSGVGRSRW